MQIIINYFKDNPTYTIVLIVSIVLCILACIAITPVKKALLKKRDNKKVTNATLLNEQSKLNVENADSACQSQEIKLESEIVTPNTVEQTECNNDCQSENTKVTENETVSNDNNEVNVIANPTENETDTDKDDKESVLKYTGKWVIYKEDNRFTADLKASNGEKMLSTESYTSLSGIKSGIDTLKKNIANENYAINLDKNGNYVFKIFSTANRLLCVGEGYSTKDQCEKAFASVKRFAKTAVIVNQSDANKD